MGGAVMQVAQSPNCSGVPQTCTPKQGRKEPWTQDHHQGSLLRVT